MNPFDIDECLGFGWRAFTRRPMYLIGITLMLGLVSYVPGAAIERMPVEEGSLPMTKPLLHFVNSIFGILVTMGSLTFYLRAHDDLETSRAGDLVRLHGFWRFVGAWGLIASIALLCTIAVLIGLALLEGQLIAQIAVGIAGAVVLMFACMRLMFALVIVIDREVRPMAAMRESVQLIRGHGWQLLWLMLVLAAVNVLGALCFLFGIFIAIPVTQLAWMHAYRGAMATAKDESVGIPLPASAEATPI